MPGPYRTVRDPMDVFFSFYNFLPAYMGIPKGAISHEEFADAIFAGASHSGHVWQHFLGYFDQRHKPEVLLVCFEDLKDNLAESVARIARHMGIGDMSVEEIAGVAEKSGFAFMRDHATHFDDHFVRRKMWDRIGIDESEWGSDQLVGKVREGGGKVGGGKTSMSAAVKERIEGRWREVMGPRGFETYEDFRKAIRQSYAEM